MAFSAQIFGPNTGISIANRKQAASMGVKPASQGRGGDRYNIKATPFTANLLKNMGGSSSFNPETGEMEFYIGGYSDFSDMFDGGGAGGSGANYSTGSHSDYVTNNPDDKTAKAHTTSSSSSNTSNSSTPKVVAPKVVSQTTAAPSTAATNEKGDGWLFGFDGIGDAMDGGGAGRSGSTYSTEGSSFDPDNTNNYVDPADNVGLGGADGMGNAGNSLTTISNMLGGNFTSVRDYTDGGGPGGSSDKFIGGGPLGELGNFMGLPERVSNMLGEDGTGADGEVEVRSSTVDPELIAGVIEGEIGQKKGLEIRNGRVVYSSTGANYQGGLDVNGVRQEFLDGQAVTAAQKAASMGGDDDNSNSRRTFGNYIAGADAGGQSGGQSGGASATDDLAIRYDSMEPSEATAAINAEITSLQTQIDAISNSGSGEDTSVMEAEIASLREQLLSYGGAAEDTSGITMIDPSTGGGFVRREVIDRETGEVRYVEVPLSVDSGQDEFREERRKGFGSSLYA
jgi:hypothetical protein